MHPASNPRARDGRRTRNPEGTRAKLLEAAFEQVYHAGFGAADVDAILARARVTKGALYHHFENKDALGYAVVDETLAGITCEKWLRPLAAAADPIGALVAVVASRAHEAEEWQFGCPVNNLAQEMSSIDEGFRTRLAAVFRLWRDGLVAALRKGQRQGHVRRDLDPAATATFIMAAYEGGLSLAKTTRDVVTLRSAKRMLIQYLESLRPVDAAARRPRTVSVS